MSLDMNTMLATQTFSQAGFDAAAKSVTHASKEAQIDAAAKDFEAMFIAEMMKPMFEGLEIDPQFGGGKGEEVFRGLLIQEYGKMMAESGQLNIASSIKAQLLQMQGMQETPETRFPAPSDSNAGAAMTEESTGYDAII